MTTIKITDTEIPVGTRVTNVTGRSGVVVPDTGIGFFTGSLLPLDGSTKVYVPVRYDDETTYDYVPIGNIKKIGNINKITSTRYPINTRVIDNSVGRIGYVVADTGMGIFASYGHGPGADDGTIYGVPDVWEGQPIDPTKYVPVRYAQGRKGVFHYVLIDNLKLLK